MRTSDTYFKDEEEYTTISAHVPKRLAEIIREYGEKQGISKMSSILRRIAHLLLFNEIIEKEIQRLEFEGYPFHLNFYERRDWVSDKSDLLDDVYKVNYILAETINNNTKLHEEYLNKLNDLYLPSEMKMIEAHEIANAYLMDNLSKDEANRKTEALVGLTCNQLIEMKEKERELHLLSPGMTFPIKGLENITKHENKDSDEGGEQ